MSERGVTNKSGHLGRSGEFAAMAEILARGWNVAIPEVDMGSDVFVAQDDGARLTRVQVKTSQATLRGDGAWTTETIKVPIAQLMREGDEVPLLYVIAARCGRAWDFVVIPQSELRDLWRRFERSREAGRRLPGRPRKVPGAPRVVAAFDLTFASDDVVGPGGVSLRPWRNAWDCFELLMLPSASAEPATTPDRSSNRAPRRPRGDGDPRG